MFSAVLLSLALGLAAPASGMPAAPLPRRKPIRCRPRSFVATTPRTGLPSTNVYAVVQDRDGAIWFGTKGGLARFDGVGFKVFRHAENDPGSLYNNGIATLMVDRQGRLWAAGLNAGLNRYDEANGSFRHWGHDPADPASLASDRVWAIAQTADGSLWVGSAGGLDRMRPDERGFEHVVDPLLGATPAAVGTVAALYVDGRGRDVDRQQPRRVRARGRRHDPPRAIGRTAADHRRVADRRQRRRSAHRRHRRPVDRRRGRRGAPLRRRRDSRDQRDEQRARRPPAACGSARRTACSCRRGQAGR